MKVLPVGYLMSQLSGSFAVGIGVGPLWEQLEDLDYADDLNLFSHCNHPQMLDKTSRLREESAKLQLKNNKKGIKVLRINNTS